MIKVYMDESGTHDNSPVIVVGAFMAKPAVWATWSELWDAKKKPVNVYHSADLHNRSGEFEEWTKAQRDEFVIKMLPIIGEAPLVGVAAGINMNEFRKHMQGREALLEVFPTPYAACLQWVLARILKITSPHHSHEKMAFVHEFNDYQKEALDTFEFVRAHHNPLNRDLSLTFADKSLAALQAADILAYESNHQLRNPNSPPRKPWLAIDPKQDRIDLMHFGEGNMPVLIERLEYVKKAYDSGLPIDFSVFSSSSDAREPA